MEIQTGHVDIEREEKVRTHKRRSSGLTGGGGGNNGRKKGGGGGGDNFDDKNPINEAEQFRPNKLRIGMWFLLVVVLMTFGGLISAYLVIATNKTAEWKPFNLPFQVWISTFLILASTFTIEMSRRKLFLNQQKSARDWLLATTILGAMFIASQLMLWFRLWKMGVYLQGNPYAGLFYILTIAHAIHVIGGIIGLGYIVLRAWNKTANTEEILRRQTSATVVSWYWHTMDGLWLILLGLLVFYK